MRTISSFNSERQPVRTWTNAEQLESVLACGLIQSVPPKVTMPSMIPAQAGSRFGVRIDQFSEDPGLGGWSAFPYTL